MEIWTLISQTFRHFADVCHDVVLCLYFVPKVVFDMSTFSNKNHCSSLHCFLLAFQGIRLILATVGL